MSFRVPAFLRPRRSFHRLRSLHLTPKEVEDRLAASQAHLGGTKPQSLSRPMDLQPRKADDFKLSPSPVVPMRGSTVIILAILSSLFFILVISFAFIGADIDEPYFQKILTSVAETSPGLVLIGESVDVDVDEPSITIHWSIIACGEDLMLPGSAGAHGSNKCGLPLNPLDIFVDSDTDPTATYDPSQIPFDRETGHRRSVQNLVQFDSDHILDVHEARLYPFDTYFLSSTIRAVSSDNQTIPIRKLATIDITSNFLIQTTDMESYSTPFSNDTQEMSRDLDMRIRRPSEARAFTLLLFGVSWILTHVTVGHVVLARRLTGVRSILKHLISAGAILVALPQLRNSMPDAPGLDGVLIDSIGFFPQMVITGLSIIILLLLLAMREVDSLKKPQHPDRPRSSRGQSLIRPPPPPPPTEKLNSIDMSQYEFQRLMKHLKGQYVFPPVPPSHRLRPSNEMHPSHRRCKTMSKIMEAGEVSHWSDDD
ncbi:hypothetical protein BD779DRAFT_733867 [Infundibulicybe gibba]|nr:hypothetical protein BD779DRAFT_733867 [Infundibulicybe gibba]